MRCLLDFFINARHRKLECLDISLLTKLMFYWWESVIIGCPLFWHRNDIHISWLAVSSSNDYTSSLEYTNSWKSKRYFSNCSLIKKIYINLYIRITKGLSVNIIKYGSYHIYLTLLVFISLFDLFYASLESWYKYE